MDKNIYVIPVSIIIAGVLIALGFYFGLSNNVNDNKQGVKNIELRNINEKTDHIKGAEKAKITIVEYSDLECPFCKNAHTTLKTLLNEYPDDLRWVYRHFPIAQLHSKAQKESEASECVYDQGGNSAFWSYIDKVFEITPSNNGLDLNQLPVLATELGLNESEFNTCLESDKNKEKVESDIEDAVKAGARGTPYFIIINSKGEKIPVEGAFPIDTFREIINSLL